MMAIDPGGTTGVAMMEAELLPVVGRRGGKGWVLDLMSLETAQYGTPQEDFAALRIFEAIVKAAPDVLVMEDFRLFPDRRHSPDTDGTLPDRMLARLDLLLYVWKTGGYVVAIDEPIWMSSAKPGVLYGSPDVVKQMPGERMVVTDKKIKELGLWRTEKKQGGGPHSMDALRHLLVYFGKISKGERL